MTTTIDPVVSPQGFLRHLYATAVARALPAHNLARYLPPPPKGRTLVLGAGKAGGAMAQALDALWPKEAPLSGLVVTRYGHIPPQSAEQVAKARIAVVEAAHPVPDEAGMAAAQRMLELTVGLTADDLVLCLISGGGSALLSLPCAGLTLADKQRINQELLNSGATIAEMNCVRKHLSRVKGGRLGAACGVAPVVTLTISDVPGDDPSVIASGPTVLDPSTCAEALRILQRHGIAVPAAIAQDLLSGALETPKSQPPHGAARSLHLIATPQQSLEAAAQAAREMGLAAYILSDEMEGESREVAKVHAALARAVAQRNQPFTRPCVLLSGGETTVTVRPRRPGLAAGRGGRAGEFCLGLAQALQGQPGVYALVADTDGIDGVQDNAGALVCPDTLARGLAMEHKVQDFLDRNDAYGYFAALGDLVCTGPTYTNVNDFRALLIL